MKLHYDDLLQMNRCIVMGFLIVVSTFFGCVRETVSEDKSIGLFDISADDKQIMFAYNNGKNSSIYQLNTDGKKTGQVILTSIDSNFFNPKYSKKDKKILFIGTPKDSPFNSVIYLANIDGSQREKLTGGRGLISDAIFSECDEKIYYCKANEYGSSSPLGRTQPHDVDVYSVDLYTRKVEKVTNLRAYGIFRISEFDCQNILMYIPLHPGGGMVIYRKKSNKELYSINPINNPRGDVSMYYTPIYSKKYNSMAFIATYELMIMNMQNKFAKVVINNAGKPRIESFNLFHNDKKIAYTMAGSRSFYIINYDGSNLKTINIRINN